MPKKYILLAPVMALGLSGCVAKTLVDVATAPVRVASQGVDWATTSQDEADRARGREIRRREERMGAMAEDYEREAEDCRDGDDKACREAVQIRQEMDELRPTIPVERGD